MTRDEVESKSPFGPHDSEVSLEDDERKGLEKRAAETNERRAGFLYKPNSQSD